MGEDSKLFKGAQEKCQNKIFASRSVKEIGYVATTNIDIVVALSVLVHRKERCMMTFTLAYFE